MVLWKALLRVHFFFLFTGHYLAHIHTYIPTSYTYLYLYIHIYIHTHSHFLRTSDICSKGPGKKGQAWLSELQEHSEEPFSAGAWLCHGDGDLEPLQELSNPAGGWFYLEVEILLTRAPLFGGLVFSKSL